MAHVRTGEYASNIMKIQLAVLLVASLVMGSASAGAQTAGTASPVKRPAAGEVAPDFALAGATRYGLLRNPVRLADYRGTTVVLAFFYQARTKG